MPNVSELARMEEEEGRYTCPVCGWDALTRPPERHTICPCCGTQFDYDDQGRSHADLRRRWLAGGARWWSEDAPAPPGWDAREQLRKAGFVD